ncbi:hypothetical protein [Nocardiopsis lucentensis]|uniref:hypothetical protein n=1 Tax=Nocardiopsis lucentensis TaxID=53441 RepID=UPI00034DA039|nr:hypothetical protein [Nocardiopsis lucentensis]
MPPPPPAAPTHRDPDALPGAGVAVRVLMFIGGVLGILIGLLIGGISLLGLGLGQASAELSQDQEAAGAFGFLLAFAGFVALIPLTYGVVSTTLAAMMGRRRRGLFWGIIAFHTVASLILVVAIIAGDHFSFVPLAFAGLMIGLMFVPGVRGFHRV